MATLETHTTFADTVIERFRAEFGARWLGATRPPPSRAYLDLHPSAVRDAVRMLYDDLGARYLISVGADRREQGAGFELLHCFAFDAADLRLAVRLTLDADTPVAASITPIIPGAS